MGFARIWSGSIFLGGSRSCLGHGFQGFWGGANENRFQENLLCLEVRANGV